MTLLAAAMFYVFFQDIGYLAMTVYTPEVYPAQIRSKGAALAMGWGRFGRMISPLVAGILIGANSIVYVWCIMAAALFTASALTLLLAYETRGNLELV
jgi:MFS family permease